MPLAIAYPIGALTAWLLVLGDEDVVGPCRLCSQIFRILGHELVYIIHI